MQALTCLCEVGMHGKRMEAHAKNGKRGLELHSEGLCVSDAGAANVTSAGFRSAGSTSAGDGLGSAIEAALARDAAADRASGGGSGGGRR